MCGWFWGFLVEGQINSNDCFPGGGKFGANSDGKLDSFVGEQDGKPKKTIGTCGDSCKFKNFQTP